MFRKRYRSFELSPEPCPVCPAAACMRPSVDSTASGRLLGPVVEDERSARAPSQPGRASVTLIPSRYQARQGGDDGHDVTAGQRSAGCSRPDHIPQEHVSATKAISDALIEYAAKRSHLRDSLIEQIVDERSDLLERLA